MSARKNSDMEKMKLDDYYVSARCYYLEPDDSVQSGYYSTQRRATPTHVFRSDALKNHLRTLIPMQRSLGCMNSNSSLSIPGALNTKIMTPTRRKIWKT
jgi:hypothetical protein